MILHEPTMKNERGEICISARVEMRRPLQYLPPALWYRFPEAYKTRLSPRSDGFVTTVMLVAMYAGEDLTVRGPVSQKLAYNLHEYRIILNAWAPKLFQMVDLQFEKLETTPVVKSRPAVASAFSGGVDSFYTLWCHLEQNQAIPEARLTHGLFVHGLDLRLDDSDNYRATAEIYGSLYRELGLELMFATTNAYQFSEFRIDWTLFDGPPLIGAAMLMSPFLRRFYMPSGMPSYLQLVPQASSPLIDHLLSTESLEVVHHGASVNRVQKLAVLTQWPATYHRLRVCSDKRRLHGLQNCSSCHKCYRTTTILSIYNALPNYKNFDQRLSVFSYLRWGLMTLLDPDQAGPIRHQAWKSGRYGMAFMIQLAIVLRVIKKGLFQFLKGMIPREQLYRIKRKVFMPESNEIGSRE